MTKFLLTYDLDKGHTEVKNYLMDLGYKNNVNTISSGVVGLPNTTLLIDKLNCQQVSSDFKNACSAYNSGCVYEKDKIKHSSFFIVEIVLANGLVG